MLLPRKYPKPPGSSHAKTSFGKLDRSQLMSRVRSSRNGTTELQMKRLLRLHRVTGWRRTSRLIGKPDFVWNARRVALFVDGCFWHGHSCGRNLHPKKNSEFWEAKFAANRRRDRFVPRKLRSLGWHVLRLWECMLIKNPRRCIRRLTRVLTMEP